MRGPGNRGPLKSLWLGRWGTPCARCATVHEQIWARARLLPSMGPLAAQAAIINMAVSMRDKCKSSNSERMTMKRQWWTLDNQIALPCDRYWEDIFYRPPPPGSDSWDCDCTRIEIEASIHHTLWVVVVHRFGFPSYRISHSCYHIISYVSCPT